MTTIEKLEEIEKTVRDMTELQLQQEKRLVEVENRKVQLPDYGPILKEILQRVENSKPQATDNTEINNLSAKVAQQTAKLPDRWRVIHLHDFSPGSKKFIIGATIILLAFCSVMAISINLWHRNGELSANSVRYRMVRQYYPEVAAWVERKYKQDPDAIKTEVERLEAEQEALRLLEEAGRQKEDELRENRQKYENIRKQRDGRKKK
ncbi:hypothetical protein [Sphingobacterium hotanense]|uniref:hypothetical protein n=1 Tax=Sphingobacterium hotanense TaxID=649196 RepID=UPI0021A6757A|nr:hypothetical protein [Sphingobacterium hotanense]MCT1526117.1 hypothetical protein [Sphingobacterium hotanense]